MFKSSRQIFVLTLGLLWSCSAWANDKLERPSDDTVLISSSEINQNLPPSKLRPLLRKLERDPTDIVSALQAASLCIELAAQTGDPRYYGFAQGALRHWWSGL